MSLKFTAHAGIRFAPNRFEPPMSLVFCRQCAMWFLFVGSQVSHCKQFWDNLIKTTSPSKFCLGLPLKHPVGSSTCDTIFVEG